MEFVINKADLVRELQTVTGVVEKRTTIPILSNLLLRADEEGVEITATDLQVGFRSRAAARVKKPGVITVDS